MKPEQDLANLGALRVEGQRVLRTGTGIKEVHVAGHQMLQVVVVPVEVGLDLMFLQQRQNVFNQFRRVAMAAAGIDRVMADDNFPLCL